MVEIGQIWKDNYNYGGGRERYVRVVSVGQETAFIRRCEPTGLSMSGFPTRETKLKRFNGSKSGFTLHLVAPAVTVNKGDRK